MSLDTYWYRGAPIGTEATGIFGTALANFKASPPWYYKGVNTDSSSGAALLFGYFGAVGGPVINALTVGFGGAAVAGDYIAVVAGPFMTTSAGYQHLVMEVLAAALDTVTNVVQASVGFGAYLGADAVALDDFFGFETKGGVNWHAITRSGGVETDTNTGIPVTRDPNAPGSNGFDRLRIE